jgi:hypothetical protein
MITDTFNCTRCATTGFQTRPPNAKGPATPPSWSEVTVTGNPITQHRLCGTCTDGLTSYLKGGSHA